MAFVRQIAGWLVVILFVVVVAEQPAAAQQVGMYNHYFYKPMIYNPAYTGDGEAANALLLHHSQWADFKGAPQMNVFTLDNNFRNKTMGLGVELVHEKRGINTQTKGGLLYAYRMALGDQVNLALGVSFGVLNRTSDYSKAVIENTTDPTLFSNVQRKTTYDGSAGMSFVCKQLEMGLAIPNLFANRVDYNDAAVHSYYLQSRHYMASLKYRVYVSGDKNVSLVPLVLVRMVPNAPFQYDGNVNVEWKDKFWIGATYKSNYALTMNAGFCIRKQLAIGYSYDIITGSIGSSAGLSHEILLSFRFGKKKEQAPETKEKESQSVVPETDSVKTELATKPTEEPKPAPVEGVKSQPEVKLVDEAASRQRKLDSLEVLKKNTGAQSPKETSPSGGVWIGTYKFQEYKDAANQTPQKGYYVVVGSFRNRDNAKMEVKRLINKGFKTTNWVYSETRNFNYVFIVHVSTEKEAVKNAAHILNKAAEFEDVWILRLID